VTKVAIDHGVALRHAQFLRQQARQDRIASLTPVRAWRFLAGDDVEPPFGRGGGRIAVAQQGGDRGNGLGRRSGGRP
jgi:hypothetical protein